MKDWAGCRSFILREGIRQPAKTTKPGWAVLKYEKGQYLNPHIDGHTPGTVRIGGAGTRKYCQRFCGIMWDYVSLHVADHVQPLPSVLR